MSKTETAHPSMHLAKVAELLKVSRPLVLRMARSGELPSTRTPQGIRVEVERLSQWIEEQRVQPLRAA